MVVRGEKGGVPHPYDYSLRDNIENGLLRDIGLAGLIDVTTRTVRSVDLIQDDRYPARARARTCARCTCLVGAWDEVMAGLEYFSVALFLL